MTETPETPTELAKRLWDTAIEHLELATKETEVGLSDAYCAIGQLSLMAAQFALNNQALLRGIPSIETPVDPGQFGLPAGAPPLPASMSGMPPGAPPLPTWGVTR